MLFTHGINSSYSKMTENRSGKAQRDNPALSKPPANAHPKLSNRKSIAEFGSRRLGRGDRALESGRTFRPQAW